jgi:hypothetical protein
VNLIAHLPDLFADAPAAKAPTPDRQFVASPSYFTMHPQLSDKKISQCATVFLYFALTPSSLQGVHRGPRAVSQQWLV